MIFCKNKFSIIGDVVWVLLTQGKETCVDLEDWYKHTKKWCARIGIGASRGQIHLGYFTNPKSAALAYDRAAAKYHKSFAALNFPL